MDSSGKIDWLFPENVLCRSSSGANPVTPGQIIQIPSVKSGRALYLDKNEGRENIYAVFSVTQWPVLEHTLTKQTLLASSSQSSRRTIQAQKPNELGMRGVGGTRVDPALINTDEKLSLERVDNGQTYTLPVPVHAHDAVGSFMIIERWFRHTNP